MSVKKTNHAVDLDYRPDCYWNVPERMLANIKGEWRRELIRNAAEAGSLDEVPSELFADEVPREVYEEVFPKDSRAGEFLPDFLSGEVEIARIVMPMTSNGVVSFRARQVAGEIHYRAVDQVQKDYVVSPDRSLRPLTLGQVLDLVNNSTKRDVENPDFRFIDWLTEAAEFMPFLEVFLAHVCVNSPYYPELSTWYVHQLDEWLRQRDAQLELDEPDLD